MKTAELTGALLDYWVARALGYSASSNVRLVDGFVTGTPNSDCLVMGSYEFGAEPSRMWRSFRPSREWAYGGPIIERYRLVVWPYRILDKEDRTSGVEQDFAAKHIGMPDPEATGDSYLIAAMRCVVASKFGDTVPDEVES